MSLKGGLTHRQMYCFRSRCSPGKVALVAILQPEAVHVRTVWLHVLHWHVGCMDIHGSGMHRGCMAYLARDVQALALIPDRRSLVSVAAAPGMD